MAFRMKKTLTSFGLKNNSNSPLHDHHTGGPIDPPKEVVVSDKDGVQTLRRTTLTGQPGNYQGGGGSFEETWNNLSPKKKEEFENFEDYKQQAIDFIEKQRQGTQREVVEEKTITKTNTDPQYETVTETIESLPLFGNQQNYDEANWKGMTRYMLQNNSRVFPAIISDFNSRRFMRTSKDELVKMAYDADPVAFETKLRQLYPEMFQSKKPLPENTRDVQQQVSPGSTNVDETDWTVVSDTTTNID